jgi:hypothetical protein
MAKASEASPSPLPAEAGGRGWYVSERKKNMPKTLSIAKFSNRRPHNKSVRCGRFVAPTPFPGSASVRLPTPQEVKQLDLAADAFQCMVNSVLGFSEFHRRAAVTARGFIERDNDLSNPTVRSGIAEAARLMRSNASHLRTFARCFETLRESLSREFFQEEEDEN